MAEPGGRGPTPASIQKAREGGAQGYEMESNEQYLGFQRVKVTEADDTKPWKPATKVEVTLADGSTEEGLDANTPFFTIKDAAGNEMTLTAAAAGHIDSLHIKGEDAGSKFDYPSLEALMQDVAAHMPEGIAAASGVSDFSVDMGKNMGREGVASLQELVEEGILTDEDLKTIEAVRAIVQQLNLEGDAEANQAYVDEYNNAHADSKLKLQVVRGQVIVPTVDTPKRQTNKLFQVWGPGADGKKTCYTMAPGRHMPRHPNPGQHMEGGKMNNDTFQESADAWFETAMLVGEDE